MTTKEIKDLFPHTCHITQELIDNSSSIAEDLLKTFIPEQLWEDMFWGLSIGQVKGVPIKVEEPVIYKGKKEKIALYLDSHIKEPRDITFELR